ncbi:uncharacterized protein LOC144630134 isoform X2 [Oculina patagonica]
MRFVSNVQTRAFRSNSFNPPPTLASHRSRRTLSLPAREKPIIPPAISETPECSQGDGERQSEEQQQLCLEANYNDDIRWFTPIVGLLVSLLLYAWACLLSLSSDDKNIIFGRK